MNQESFEKPLLKMFTNDSFILPMIEEQDKETNIRDIDEEIFLLSPIKRKFNNREIF